MKKKKQDENMADVESIEEQEMIGCESCDESLQKCQEMEENWKRQVAEFANYKKRTEEEKGAILNVAKAEVVVSFLPMYDSLNRAMNAEELDMEGLEKVSQMFEGILKGYEIEKIDLSGGFDPSICEAIGFAEGDKDNDGQIAEVVETGFRAGEFIVKPAKVLIYKKK